MEVLKLWFHEYPMLVGLAFGLVVLLVLGVVLGTVMQRAGMSLKPLVWFFVLMALVAGPQAVMHVLDVVAFKRQQAAPASTAPPSVSGLLPVAWDRVFGPDADPALATDPRLPLQAVLGAAVEARLVFNARGESALAARFSGPVEARGARDAYGTFFQFAGVTGADALGWTARRYGGTGEWNHVVVAGNELYAWTGPTRESVVAQRERALGPLGTAGRDALPAVGEPLRAHEARLVTGGLGWRVMVPFATVNLALVVLWFFWGAAWATRVPAMAPAPLPVDSLRARIAQAYGADSPVEVRMDPAGTVTLDWRYRDARWLDMMRAHRMKRTHRLVLHLDAGDHTVRVREYWSAFDASAGAEGLKLAWQQASGIQFFQKEHLRVYGLQLDAQGRPTGNWSQAFDFDLQAMKQPALEAVTQAGWRWQPTLLKGPAWLCWLTG